MSKTATLTWGDPSNKFTGIEVAMRVGGAPDFTALAVVGPGIGTHVIPDLVDGDYEFKVTALNGSLRSAGVVVSASVVTEVAPDDVSGLTVTLS